MGQSYQHLGLQERCEIAQRRGAGQSIRQIATALDRSPSSISRELKRNHGSQVGYKPAYAEEQAAARRWKGELNENPKLSRRALAVMPDGWG